MMMFLVYNAGGMPCRWAHATFCLRQLKVSLSFPYVTERLNWYYTRNAEEEKVKEGRSQGERERGLMVALFIDGSRRAENYWRMVRVR